MSQSFEIYLDGLEIDVKADVTKSHKGSRDEPPCEAEMEITEVKFFDMFGTHDIKHLLRPDVMERIRSACWEQLEEEEDFEPEEF